MAALAVALWLGLLPVEAGVWLWGCAAILLGVAVVARCSPLALLGRAVVVLPFVLVPAALRLLGGEAVAAVVGMAARGVLAAFTAALLMATTPFPDLLAAASALGLPDVMVQTTALTYRYLVLLRMRAAAMVRSARARGYGPNTPRRFAVVGGMLGTLLLSSLDRAERVHRSMLARGYAGRFPTARRLRMGAADWALMAGVWAALGASLAVLW